MTIKIADLASTQVVGWDSGAAGAGAKDAGFSRLGAASVALGNGTASDTTGILSLTKILLGTGGTLTSAGAATLQLGAADAAAPVAQTLKAQSGLTGSGSNIGGPDLTIKPGLGTGFGTTSTYGLGRVVFSTPVQQATGTTIQTYATTLAIGPNTITSATSNPVLDMVQTWNNASLTATAIKLNVTDTSSNAASLLLDLQVATVSQFSLSKAGLLTIAGSLSAATGNLNIGGGSVVSWGAPSNTTIGTTGNGFLVIGQGGTPFSINYIGAISAGVMQFGAADAATAVAQTLQVQSVVTGTADTAGVNWTNKGSASTGSGASGNIIFQVAGKGAASTTVNTYNTGLTIVGGTTNNTNVGYPSVVVVGTAALATTATDGFLYIPTCAGTPSGTPTAQTGRIAMVYDTSAHQFWFYDGGWKQPKTPAAAAIVTWQ